MSQFVTFTLENELLGVDVQRVQEVLGLQPTTPIPRANESLCGLLNLRGQVVLVVDLRKRLQFPDSDRARENLIVQTQGGLFSLLVDKAGSVITLGDDSREPVPETLHGPLAGYLSAVHKLPEGLLGILDVDRLLAEETALA